MALQRDTLPVLTAIRTKAARFANDREMQRYTAAEYLEVIIDVLRELHIIRTNKNPGSALLYSDEELDDPDEGILELSAGVYRQGIYNVQDLTNPAQPIDLLEVPLNALEINSNRRRYSHMAGTTAGAFGQSLIIRPKPNRVVTLRVWYLAPAIVTDDPDDTFPLAAEWQELVAVMVGLRLRGPNREEAPYLLKLEMDLKNLYKERCGPKVGAKRIPNRRTGLR